MLIRKAVREDIQAMLDIYNYEVEYGTATMDIYPRSYEEWEKWFERHNVDNHPLIVAELDGKTVGYVSLSLYRERAAYNSTVELSIYVERSHRCEHIGSALMEEIIRIAKEDPTIHMIVSVINSSNVASIRIHEKFGFKFCGMLHEAAIKFGEYLDISHYELHV